MTKDQEMDKLEQEIIDNIRTIRDTIWTVIESLQEIEHFDQEYITLGKIDLDAGFIALARGVRGDSEAGEYFKSIQ